MPVYYRGPDAWINDTSFRTRSTVELSFPIRELRRIHVVRHESVGSLAPRPVRICFTSAAGACAGLAAAGWPVLDRPWLTVVALLVLPAWTAAAVASWIVGRRGSLELRAVFRGRMVCLYRSTDPLTFGQVCRALLRVVEKIEDDE